MTVKPCLPLALVLLVVAAALTACGDEAPDGAPHDETGPAAAEPLPPAPTGLQWVSWHDVAVQVPAAWDNGYEPQSDWCVGGEPEPGEPAPSPYYTFDPGSGGVLDIMCVEAPGSRPEEFGPAPESLWAPHVVLEPSDGGPDRALTDDGWTMSSRTIGDVRVRVLARDSGDVDAGAILDSARQFSVDDHGCEPTSPVQAAEFARPSPFDVATVTSADSISICQYSRAGGPDAPALTGSRRIDGDAADRLLSGLQHAPAGTGPDRPSNCVDDYYGDTAIAIRIHHDSTTDDVYAYYDWCFGNGTDDGTQHRQLTARTCAPLFAAPVRLLSFSSFLRSICDPVA
jgi:hypothetical protein